MREGPRETGAALHGTALTTVEAECEGSKGESGRARVGLPSGRCGEAAASAAEWTMRGAKAEGFLAWMDARVASTREEKSGTLWQSRQRHASPQYTLARKHSQYLQGGEHRSTPLWQSKHRILSLQFEAG